MLHNEHTAFAIWSRDYDFNFRLIKIGLKTIKSDVLSVRQSLDRKQIKPAKSASSCFEKPELNLI